MQRERDELSVCSRDVDIWKNTQHPSHGKEPKAVPSAPTAADWLLAALYIIWYIYVCRFILPHIHTFRFSSRVKGQRGEQQWLSVTEFFPPRNELTRDSPSNFAHLCIFCCWKPSLLSEGGSSAILCYAPPNSYCKARDGANNNTHILTHTQTHTLTQSDWNPLVKAKWWKRIKISRMFVSVFRLLSVCVCVSILW